MDKALEDFQVACNGDKDIFWQKLAKENRWSLRFSKNAFTEYKKFIYLAKKYGCRVVPSQIVDNVWHLHMTFTKSYWNDLCQDILEMEFHHIPSSQGRDAELLDIACYEKTKALYEKEFGYTPPLLYWPHVQKKAVNKFHIFFISICSLTVLTACTSTLFDDIELTLKWVIGIYAIYKVLSWLSKKGFGGKCGGSGCGSSCGGD